jgi:hypothetical protein
MRANDYDPSTLSKVDAAAVVELAAWARQSAPPGGSIQDLIRSAATREVMLTESEDVERIADLWRVLRPAEQARCHMPRFGLRLFLGGTVVAEASLCWECNNAYGYAGSDAIAFTFDATAPAAVLLLIQVRHVLGVSTRGA